ncbi:unnamed protein product [Lota lota]
MHHIARGDSSLQMHACDCKKSLDSALQDLVFLTLESMAEAMGSGLMHVRPRLIRCTGSLVHQAGGRCEDTRHKCNVHKRSEA